MKKETTAIIVALVIILGMSALIYGLYNNKSNDNLPHLTSLAEMDEAEVNELLVGYRRIQLREVWQEPDKTNSNEDIWAINEKMTLIVNYNNKDKVVACGFSIED